MRLVLQRVSRASVSIEGEAVGKIDRGILALVGINDTDDESVFERMLSKMVNLRIFEDTEGKMNISLKDNGFGLLIVPNFTIYSDARKGNRPSFAMGAKPEKAKVIFEAFTDYCQKNYPHIQKGVFGADMKVELLNDGPVTILLDSDRLF
ncbi:MAG: D-tyrosyl-tRNA(Tyr) deacylase [Firmicutes bacterium]|nr:D-tyrosyl-tRNA(Tyr) deacylase [Bacillota bacterium]